MAMALQNFIHTFFSNKSVSAGAGTIVWASAEGSPSDYNSALTEKVDAMGIRISVTFNASAIGDLKVHMRKNSDSNLHTETITIKAPGLITAQIKEFWVYGPFSDLDLGIENEDTTYAALVSVSVFDGTKITGVTAA